MPSLKEFWSAVRLRATPLIIIESHDEIATYKNLLEYSNESGIVPVWSWDCARGYQACNELAEGFDQPLSGCEQVEDMLLELDKPERIPARAVIICHWRNEYWQSPQCRQALINLRERFKRKMQALTIIMPFGSEIPSDVRVHVLTHQEALPDQIELGEIAEKATESARSVDTSIPHLEGPQKDHVTAILKGMSAFQAEQQAFMALRREVGIDSNILQQSKIELINSTPGLTCWQGGETFQQVIGLAGIQTYLERLINGRTPVRLVMWVDEVEKAVAGADGDTSGISQDYMGTLLSHLQDTRARGILLFGQPGTGKSLVAKATGSLASCLTIRLDLGACKSSLVGESEARLRKALAIEQAISEPESTLWLFTCNGVKNLPSELRSRFRKEYFYDFPGMQAQQALWQFYIDKFELDCEIPQLQSLWTGREIERACREAWELNIPLNDAMEGIIPVAVASWESALNRRKEAHLRYLDAQQLGVYRMPSENDQGRMMAFNN